EMRIWSADGALRRIVSLPDRYLGGASWSPDGKSVGYIGGPSAGNRHVSAVDVAPGSVRQGATLASNNGTFLWTSDSRAMIASIVSGTGAQRKVVFEHVDADGTSRTLRELVIGPTPNFGVAISGTIAVAMRNGELHRVTLDGDSSDVLIMPRAAGRYAG